MDEQYHWFVFLHLVGLVLFAICHGGSVFMAFRIRSERDPQAIVAAAGGEPAATAPMYLGLLLLVVGGIGAAAGADLWGEPWIIASVVVLHRRDRRDVRRGHARTTCALRSGRGCPGSPDGDARR